MPSLRSKTNVFRDKDSGIERRPITGVHAYFEVVGQEDREFRVVLSFRSKEGEFDAVLTPLIASGLNSEIRRVLEAGQPRLRFESHRAT